MILAGGLSAFLTYILHVKLKQGAVRASALVGVVAGLLTFIFPKYLSINMTENLPLIIFGASFVGMVSSEVLSNYILIGISGSLFAVVFMNTSSLFSGFGGGLGTGACIAVLVTLSVPVLTKNRRTYKRLIIIKRKIINTLRDRR